MVVLGLEKQQLHMTYKEKHRIDYSMDIVL